MHGELITNRRILIVDDTPAIHQDFKKLLASAEGSAELDSLMASVLGEISAKTEENFELTSAMQGLEALQIVEKHRADGSPFAAAFVDMRMPPGWDGLQTIEKLWAVDPNIQVVICTAYSDYSWQEIISRIGGDGKLLILKKPFDAIEVRQLASTLCRKWELERAAESENQKLLGLSQQLTELNAGLEQSVAERTASLQLVLDSTGEGIFTVDLEGRVLSERSRMVESWLGEFNETTRMWDYLAYGDPDRAADFQLAFEQIADDILPFKVTSAQAPQRILRDGRTFDLDYREIRTQDQLERVLIVVRDVSAQVEAEHATQAIVELQTIIGNFFENSEAFRSSIGELEQILQNIKICTDPLVSRRLIHTLKGNTAILGFRSFSQHVHDLESAIVDRQSIPETQQIQNLEARWNSELAKLGPFSEFCNDELVQIRKDDLDLLLEQIQRNTSHAELLSFAQQWKLQPLTVPLKRLATQAARLASQLNKQLETQIDDGGLCMPAERLAEFWPTMVHLVRNAIDHGMESPEQRLSIGKPEQGLLSLQADVANGWLQISLRDDGQGIDWEKIRSKAEKNGLPAVTPEDLIDALFSDGFSTREVTTELSGRGVGLSSVREAAERCGGGISVTSVINQGTTFIVRLPWTHSELTRETESIPSNSRSKTENHHPLPARESHQHDPRDLYG